MPGLAILSELAPEQEPERKFVLHYVLLVIIFAFAVILLYNGATAYFQGRVAEAGMKIALGAAFLLLWGITLRRLREISSQIPIAKKRFEMVTVTKCSRCGFKSVRNFERDDYVMRRASKCPKCNKPMLISSIYLKAESEPKRS